MRHSRQARASTKVEGPPGSPSPSSARRARRGPRPPQRARAGVSRSALPDARAGHEEEQAAARECKQHEREAAEEELASAVSGHHRGCSCNVVADGARRDGSIVSLAVLPRGVLLLRGRPRAARSSRPAPTWCSKTMSAYWVGCGQHSTSWSTGSERQRSAPAPPPSARRQSLPDRDPEPASSERRSHSDGDPGPAPQRPIRRSRLRRRPARLEPPTRGERSAAGDPRGLTGRRRRSCQSCPNSALTSRPLPSVCVPSEATPRSRNRQPP